MTPAPLGVDGTASQLPTGLASDAAAAGNASATAAGGGSEARPRRAWRWVLWGAAVACAGVAVVCAGALASGQVRLMTVDTGSMGEAAPIGSLVVMAPTVAAEHRLGDVIAYRREDGPTVVHRVVAQSPDGSVTTRGDANVSADTPLPPGQATWQVLAVVDNAGRVAGALSAPAGLVLLSLTVGVGVFLVASGSGGRRSAGTAADELGGCTTENGVHLVRRHAGSTGGAPSSALPNGASGAPSLGPGEVPSPLLPQVIDDF